MHVDNSNPAVIRNRAFSGQLMDLGNGNAQVLVWQPDTESGDEGYCIDFPFADIDDLITLLQQLKTSPAVPVELHTVHEHEEVDSNGRD